MKTTHYFVFDVESIGLHGQAYAVGGCIIDRQGYITAPFRFAIQPMLAGGTDEDRAWVTGNIRHIEVNYERADWMRNAFWTQWEKAKATHPNIRMAADCGWPVEANFLTACIADQPAIRKWQGPYPFMEIASYLEVSGLDPLGTYTRHPSEQPKHCPLADARQSARLLIKALNILESQSINKCPECGGGERTGCFDHCPNQS